MNYDFKNENKKLKVVFFTSRNKDNKDLEGFKQRRCAFVTKKTVDELLSKFNDFVNKGVVGEKSRFYMSLNSRDEQKVQKALMVRMLTHDVALEKMESVVASVAGEKVNGETKFWFFDYDDKEEKLDDFVKELLALFNEEEVVKHKTPNGYAVVVPRGFYADTLLQNWQNVSLEKDGMLFVKMQEKG